VFCQGYGVAHAVVTATLCTQRSGCASAAKLTHRAWRIFLSTRSSARRVAADEFTMRVTALLNAAATPLEATSRITRTSSKIGSGTLIATTMIGVTPSDEQCATDHSRLPIGAGGGCWLQPPPGETTSATLFARQERWRLAAPRRHRSFDCNGVRRSHRQVRIMPNCETAGRPAAYAYADGPAQTMPCRTRCERRFSDCLEDFAAVSSAGGGNSSACGR
jgi:hypothetical protein